MKKMALLAAFMIAGCSNTHNPVHIAYKGEAVDQKLHLENGDVVMIDTTVPVGTKVLIEVGPAENSANASELRFESSMENAPPKREGAFVDQMFTGANPGWVSYTFTAEKPSDVLFKIHP